MSKHQTITINGVEYDAYTGMRVEGVSSQKPAKTEAAAMPHHRSVTSNALHGSRTARSQTLSRRHVKAPAHTPPIRAKKAPIVVHHAKSEMITKFGPIEPATVRKVVSKPIVSDIGPVPHPKVAKLTKNVATKPIATAQPVTHAPAPSAKQIKNHAIQTALNHAVAENKTTKPHKRRHSKLLSIATASLAIVLLAGYLTYINMPSLSVRVAAAQAGIDATYPSYQPVGYNLNGPVAFQDGQVSMKFVSNTNPQNFTLNQSRSGWDSSALLENYVRQASNGKYETYSDSGLTLYVFGTSAAWVNGGILHTISGDSQLSSDQIRHIATSM